MPRAAQNLLMSCRVKMSELCLVGEVLVDELFCNFERIFCRAMLLFLVPCRSHVETMSREGQKACSTSGFTDH
jgi:hypothetical protein